MKLSARVLKTLSKEENSFQKLIIIADIKALKNKNAFKALSVSLQTRISNALDRQLKEPKESGSISVLGQGKEPDLVLSFLPKERNAYKLLSYAGALLKASVPSELKSLGICILESSGESLLAEALAAAVQVRVFQMPLYGKKAKENKPYVLSDVAIFSSQARAKEIAYGAATANGTNLVRSLGTIPSNFLNTESYGEKIRELCKENGLQVKFYSNTELKKMGAGAFTAVDQGNPDSKGGIYEITYNPKKAKNKNHIALVGKGLCFDTGGYDIKTNGYMISMKGDMTGSAVALSNLVVASQMKLPLKLKAFLGVTENHVSPLAYKADDVVTAMNGVSIEVINTDAEGRMVLADTLALTCKSKPDLIIDYATLTGAATIAIGTSYSAVFSNREELLPKLQRAGTDSGERVWPFPLDKECAKSLESQIADTIQCVKTRSPDHMMAAYFLSLFVEENIPWVHVDLSCADKAGGLAHVDSTFTGFGVRWTLEFLKSRYKV